MNTATQTPSAERAYYVYGVVPSTRPEPEDSQGVGNPPYPIKFVRNGRIAAAVSEIDAEEPLGTPDDVRAHAKLLDDLAADYSPVLPFRFGGVVRDERAVAEDLLGPFEDSFAAALEKLSDRAQFTVRGSYRESLVLSEILTDRPDIAQLREETRNLPEDAAYYQRIRLGELVSQEIAARREADHQVLVDRLSPLAEAVSVGSPEAAQAVDASFLVHRAQRAEFEAAAEDLARVWSGRIDLRLLGPLAPYDFVSVVEQAEGMF